MTESRSPVLVLGIGNYLMGDEGLGVHAARELSLELKPGLADVLDGGTAGFLLMEYFVTYRHVILIDAVLEAAPPGEIRQIRPRFASDFPKAMSTHEIGLKDLVEALLLLDKMPDVHLFTVSIEKIQPLCIELSEGVRNALPELKLRVTRLAVSLMSGQASF